MELELSGFGVVEMNEIEMTEVDGGGLSETIANILWGVLGIPGKPGEIGLW